MITWNTNCNAPCIGMIVNEDGRDLLIQSDWDYPGVASTFGWDIKDVQNKAEFCCDGEAPCDDPECEECKKASAEKDKPTCEHEGTDGTVTCKECGLTAMDFITAAADFLRENNGKTAEDPGYFTEEE